MPLDPRNVPTSADAATAQRIADLERRVAALERLTSTNAQDGPPATPTTTETVTASGAVKLRKSTEPRGGTTVVDSTGNRAYFWTGTAWRSTTIS